MPLRYSELPRPPTRCSTALLFVHTKLSHICLHDHISQQTSGHWSVPILKRCSAYKQHMPGPSCAISRAGSFFFFFFFLGQWREGEIRQEVGVVGGQAGRSWSTAIGEKEVVGNVGSSGGGVGCRALSILQSKCADGARRSYENKSQHVGWR